MRGEANIGLVSMCSNVSSPPRTPSKIDLKEVETSSDFSLAESLRRGALTFEVGDVDDVEDVEDVEEEGGGVGAVEYNRS